jgi:hypothetical protein
MVIVLLAKSLVLCITTKTYVRQHTVHKTKDLASSTITIKTYARQNTAHKTNDLTSSMITIKTYVRQNTAHKTCHSINPVPVSYLCTSVQPRFVQFLALCTVFCQYVLVVIVLLAKSLVLCTVFCRT